MVESSYNNRPDLFSIPDHKHKYDINYNQMLQKKKIKIPVMLRITIAATNANNRIFLFWKSMAVTVNLI
jgi:hypothetical protein